MDTQFGQWLATALVADYFLIMDLISPDGDSDFKCQAQMAPSIAQLTSNLGIERNIYESQDGTWVQFVFTEPGGKGRLNDYLNNFNQTYRIRRGIILMPDIYDGETEPKKDICNPYLGRITAFFDANLEGSIAIPVSNDDGPNMLYAVYTMDGKFTVIPMK